MINTQTHFIKGYKIIEFKHTNIYIIENAIEHNLCSSIIECINTSDLTLIPISHNQNVECFTPTNIRAIKGLHELLQNKLISIFEIITILLPKMKISGFSPYELRKVYGETKLHCDGIYDDLNKEQHIRCGTLVIGLNDDYDGGIYTFPYHNISFKLNTGAALFFPPYWTHPHKVSSVNKDQFRYIFSTWGLQ